MSGIRPISRVSGATTNALRGMDSVAAAGAARVSSAAASTVGGGMNTQGARVQSPSVSFSAVMGTQGADSSPGGMDLDRAMMLYVEARTLESQEMLAAQKSGETKRASSELRERVEAALDGGGHVVRARPPKLAAHHDALPPAMLLLTGA